LRWGGGKVIILIILPALQGLHGEEKLELAEKLDSLFRGNDKQRRRGGNKIPLLELGGGENLRFQI